MRINSFMQKSLYGGTTLQPLAYEGFFPDKFGKLNDRQIPATAAKLNMIIVLGMCVV
jgi:amino acid transporter